MGHDLVEDLGGGNNAGKPGSGMGAGADHEQVFDFLGNVVRPEPGQLGDHRFDAEGGPLEREQPVAEIDRVISREVTT
jgi:hypothetical protein